MSPIKGSDDSPWNDWAQHLLSRLESKIDSHGEKLIELTEGAKQRDQKLKEVQDRQSTDAHKANDVAQILTGRIENLKVTSETANKRVEQLGVQIDGLGTRVEGLKTSIDHVDSRVEKLELPAIAALAAKERKRARITRWMGRLAVLGTVAWWLFDPVWKALAPTVVQRFFNGGVSP